MDQAHYRTKRSATDSGGPVLGTVIAVVAGVLVAFAGIGWWLTILLSAPAPTPVVAQKPPIVEPASPPPQEPKKDGDAAVLLALKSSLQSMQERLEVLSKKNDELVAEVRNKDGLIHKAEARIKEASKLLDQAKSGVEEEKVRLDELRNSLGMKQAELDSVTSERDRLATQTADLSKQIETLAAKTAAKVEPVFNTAASAWPSLLRERHPGEVKLLTNFLEQASSKSISDRERLITIRSALDTTSSLRKILSTRYEITDRRALVAQEFLSDIESKLQALRR